MGFLRLLLATGVVLGHARGWGGIPQMPDFITPYHAVQGFFVFSGFYMSLSFPKYKSAWQFYLSRLSRLLPAYWIVAAVTVGLWIVFPTHPLSAPYLKTFHEARGFWSVVILISNLFLIGSDSFDYFPRSLPQYWAVPQVWSLGAELWFYLLVPVLVRARTRHLLVMVAGGIGLRLVLLASHLPFFPWQQKVFPAELSFFLIGMLSHRLYAFLAEHNLLTCVPGWAILGYGIVFLTLGNKLHLFPRPYQDSLWNSATVAATCCLAIPATFHLTKNSTVDKCVGDLAYPVYLWHIAIGYYFEPAQRLWCGWFLVLLSVLASVPLIVLVDRPLQRWRTSWLQREPASKAAPTPRALATAAA